MLAIAQLQQLAGQDTRVTASSTLVSESNVKATGVWRSWEGSDHDSTGKPTIPEYSLKNEAGKPGDPPGISGSGRFLGWLASPFANASPDTASLSGLASTQSAGYVPLVASGSVAKTTDQVYVNPTMISVGAKKGAFAWWASGDNSKAMLNVDRVAEPTTTVGWNTRMKSDGRADAASFGLDAVKSLPQNVSIPSTKTLNLVNKTAEIRKLHDLTTFNRGLLTNTATGGWRKDLSLLSENFAGLPKTQLPSFTLKPGQVQTFSKAQVSTSPDVHPPNALLYPWANYKNSPSFPAYLQVPPICSWSALADYMLQYRYLTTSSAGRTAMPFFAQNFVSPDRRFGFQDQVRRSPNIAKLQWIFSFCSRKRLGPPDQSNPTKTYQAALMVTPVLTLWNPYNVELTTSSFRMGMKQLAPISFSFKVGTQSYPDTTLQQILNGPSSSAFNFGLNINSAFTLPPGGTMIFSLDSNIPQENTSASSMILKPGFLPNGGFVFYGLNKGNAIYAQPSDRFFVERFAYSGKTLNGYTLGLGVYMDFGFGNIGNGHRAIFREDILGGPTVVNALYPPLTVPIDHFIHEVEGSHNQPFASAILGFRPATPRPKESKFDNLATKGMLTSNPLTFNSETGGSANPNAQILLAGTGNYHPMNSPYDFSFEPVNGWIDTQNIPNTQPGKTNGYIISGSTAADGLSRCVVAELPTRPLQSLVELMHFDARNNNPIPPFHFNLIGNGSANPVFAPDQVSVTTSYDIGMCNDDCYLLNHMLFDDWFVSSIAPDLNDFSKTEKRPILKVYQDHLDSRTPLPNRFYLPAPGASATFMVNDALKDVQTGMYGYETVASQLEVQGMINVNSVSVEAWKAWLRQGRDSRVPYLTANGSTTLDGTESFSFPRTSIAGDKAAGSGSGDSNPGFADAAQFSGYPTLSGTQIDALAEQIVLEIRKRGPFLSLSEFLNRRLTTNKSLAAAGTIQQALDTLSTGPSNTNPYARLQAMAHEIKEQPPGITDFKFPEVALGSSAFGMPGWIRQADILKRLAPMISARDDTFTIRGYGDSRDKNDNSKILATAWCEVVVCRRAAFSDPADPPQINPHSPAMTSEVNKRYGRRFEIVSFRWLNAGEI